MGPASTLPCLAAAEKLVVFDGIQQAGGAQAKVKEVAKEKLTEQDNKEKE